MILSIWINFSLSIKFSNSPHFTGSLPFDANKKKKKQPNKKTKTTTTLVPQPLAKLF